MTTRTTISEAPDALPYVYAEPIEEVDDNNGFILDDSELDLFPTVRLSQLNRTETSGIKIPLVEAEEYSDPDFDEAIEFITGLSGPLTKAEEILVVAPLVVVGEADDTDSESPTQQEQHNHYATVRAEYISASFFKDQDPNASLGIKLGKNTSNTVSIRSISPHSPAAQSPLRVGDTLISINQRACAQMTTPELHNAMSMPGMITLVVHNQGGAPDVVESMITKLYADQKIGMGIKNCSTKGILYIGNIKAQLGAAQSLLNPEDQLLSINGIHLCEQRIMNQVDAVQTIADAPTTVTIRAMTSRGTGVVVAEFEEEEEVPQRVLPKWLQSTLTLQRLGRKPIRQPVVLQQQEQPSCAATTHDGSTQREQQRFGTSSLNWVTTSNSRELFQEAF